MERAFSLEYGVAGVCVLLTIMILIKVGEYVLSIAKEKETLSETAVKNLSAELKDNTQALRDLSGRLEKAEALAADIPKLKIDVRRFYTAIKTISGDEWPRVRDEIMKDSDL